MVFNVHLFCVYVRLIIAVTLSPQYQYACVNNVGKESLYLHFLAIRNVKSTIKQLNSNGPFGHNLIAIALLI